MHRVELKEDRDEIKPPLKEAVPNAPCGVESQNQHQKLFLVILSFLMHRVELKV